MALFKPLCKYTATVTSVRDIAPTLRHAIQVAQSGTPGKCYNISYMRYNGCLLLNKSTETFNEIMLEQHLTYQLWSDGKSFVFKKLICQLYNTLCIIRMVKVH